ncbi:uncharacterized protein LOC143850577 [Tasmannia lanceolata]|uniref:uncharacterized protein LOC143850577 n=1 Tax=Tasmannia lanceolata TaxID=3420 RepID=UPI004062957A
MDSDSTASSRDLSLESDARNIPSNPLPEYDMSEEDSGDMLTPPPLANDPVAETNKNLEQQDSFGEGRVWSLANCTSSEEGRVGSSVAPAPRRRNIAPDWLPVGWHMETSSVTTGMEDRSSGSSQRHTRGGSLSKEKTAMEKKAMAFDHNNVPEKVTWVLTEPAKGLWSPFLGEEKVPESTKKEWDAAFERRSRGLD